MELKQLEYIVAIAENKNITKAAKMLFISQSALDQQLLKLENTIGVPLFIRSKSEFKPTQAGEVYVRYAKKILALKSEAYMIINDLADKMSGTFSIGLTLERGVPMFMAVYPHYYQRYPNITVSPQELSVRRQYEMISQDYLDIGFVTLTNHRETNLEFQPIFKEQFVLAVPANHPLAESAGAYGGPLATIELERFRDETFVLMRGTSTQRDVIDPLFMAAGFEPRVLFETASNHTLLAMVENGLSCTILPWHYAKTRSPSISLFRLPQRPSWEMMVCYKRKKYLSQATKYFIELAIEYWKKVDADQLPDE